MDEEAEDHAEDEEAVAASSGRAHAGAPGALVKGVFGCWRCW